MDVMNLSKKKSILSLYMQIHLRSVLDSRVYTLEVEGNTTYEDIVEMLMRMKVGLLTTNPLIFIERHELEPGMKCVDIDVKRESEGQVIDPRPPPCTPHPTTT